MMLKGLSYLFTFAFLGYMAVTDGWPSELIEASKKEELKFSPDYQSLPSDQLEMEHKAGKKNSIKEVVEEMILPKAAKAVDKVASNVVKLADGVVEDLGNFLVDTVDQLPQAIKEITEAVGSAIDVKKEKVLILVKGVKLDDKKNSNNGEVVKQYNIDKIDDLENKLKTSHFQSSLTDLQNTVATLLGRIIGVAYSKGEDINAALQDSITKLKSTIRSDPKSKVKILKKEDEPDETGKIA